MEDLFRRDGKAIKELGFYDPILKKVSIDKYYFCKFIENGAYPTNTVRHLAEKTFRLSQFLKLGYFPVLKTKTY